MFLAGVPTETIQIMGRWKSQAFLRYIRIHVQHQRSGHRYDREPPQSSKTKRTDKVGAQRRLSPGSQRRKGGRWRTRWAPEIEGQKHPILATRTRRRASKHICVDTLNTAPGVFERKRINYSANDKFSYCTSCLCHNIPDNTHAMISSLLL